MKNYTQVILQPSGDFYSNMNFKKTIENSINLDYIKSYIKEDEYNNLEKLFPNKQLKLWAVKSNNVNKWNRIRNNDIVIFYKLNEFYMYGIIVYKLHNPDLAKLVYISDSDDDVYEYIYFIDEINYIKKSIYRFNDLLNYKKLYKVFSFSILDEQQSNIIIDDFNLISKNYYPDISKNDYNELIQSLEDNNLDRSIFTLQRMEQTYLRKYLFDNKKTEVCGICKNEYPVNFLWASHIKKRSLLTINEKKDLNVIMPMCKFGCDDLYENGYIYIDENGFIRNSYKTNLRSVNEYINRIEGKKTEYFNVKTEHYFSWHRNFTKF